MIRPRSRSGPRVRAIVALTFLLVSPGSGSTKPPDVSSPLDPRPTSHPIAVEVRSGRASFDIPTAGARSQTLVIVSALSRNRGPFPIQIQARRVEKTKPIELATERPIRRPKLAQATPSPAPPTVSGLPPSHRTFQLLVHAGDVSQASNYEAVDGRLRAVGRRIQVYVDARDREEVSPETLRDVVSTFDDKIYPDAAARFGQAADVDQDGRFTVLFSSWLTRLAGGKARVDGFVRGADLDLGLGQPYGNRCDMIYLNSTLKTGPYLRTIVAHEYTHAVTFSRKALSRGKIGLEEEGWLDEALAHLVEDSHGFARSNIDYRVSSFLSRPERYRLVVDDYYAADLFRSHGNRGATYLFLRWCVDHYGPGLVDTLICSDRRGVGNLEEATGSSFASLFRKWTVALYLSGLDPSSSPESPYRSIDVRGDLEDWILAGPRTSLVSPGGQVDSWLAEGTTAHFAIVEGSPEGAVSIEVSGPPEAEIQVTAVPLPVDLGRPELTIRRLRGADGQIGVRAEISELGGAPIRLGALAWEPLVPADDPRTAGFLRGRLDTVGIVSAFGTTVLPAGGSLQSTTIPLSGIPESAAPTVFKAVGTDARGRRVAAWSLLEPGSKRDDLAVESPHH
jgi:hypothetical protein